MFGMQHLAPLLLPPTAPLSCGRHRARRPMVDLVDEGFDVAIRIAGSWPTRWSRAG
ncbi:MAG: hypothetical protein IPI73_10655 [Betaproteobacteria bacterium]|nr:hypothetical protein [Betaproteobacteria bacterium]